MTNGTKKSQHPSAPVWLIAALALVLALILGPSLGEALGNLEGQMWIVTPEAQARTDAAQCGTGQICKELCYYGLPQGEFYCFFNH